MKPKAFLIALTTITMLFIVNCGKTTTVPDGLIGVWKTVAPKYAGTFFELTRTSIRFGTKEGTVNTYAIINIKKGKKKAEEEWTLYTIYYVAQEGLEYEFSIHFLPERNGIIRFKNQVDIVWTREREVD